MHEQRLVARVHSLDEVPRAEVLQNSRDFCSMTSGPGSCRFEFDHHEQVPQNIEQRVIDTRRASVLEDDLHS